MRALVVFRECREQHRLAWMLKPGFRHCFAAVENNGLWIEFDYRDGIPEIKYLTTSDFDLAGHYRDQGMYVVEVTQGDRPPTFPLFARNCVGMVKALLCIRNSALTPYGLYRRLHGIQFCEV